MSAVPETQDLVSDSMPEASPALGMGKLNAVTAEALARDLVLYGRSDLEGVLESYGLTEEDLEQALLKHPLLENEIKRIRKQVDQDPRAAIRIAANEVVGLSIPHLLNLIQGTYVEPKDRVKAIELAAKLADVLPKDAKASGPGVAVQINMGSSAPAEVVAPINPPVVSHDAGA